MTITPPPPPPSSGPEWNQPPPNQPPPYGGGPYGTGSYGSEPPNKNNKYLIAGIIGFAVLLLILLVVTIVVVTNDDDPAPTPTATTVTAVPPPVVTTAPAPPVSTEPVTPPTETTGPTSQPTSTIPSSPRPGASDTQYVGALLLTDTQGTDHSKYWGPHVQDQLHDVLRWGYAICSAYDGGATPRQIVSVMVDNGIPRGEANWARAAAVVTLCPEH